MGYKGLVDFIKLIWEVFQMFQRLYKETTSGTISTPIYLALRAPTYIP